MITSYSEWKRKCGNGQGFTEADRLIIKNFDLSSVAEQFKAAGDENMSWDLNAYSHAFQELAVDPDVIEQTEGQSLGELRQ